PDSMDQDPRPGVIQVDTLRGVDGASRIALDVERDRYRMRQVGSIPGYTWAESTNGWAQIDAVADWPSDDLGYVFLDRKVQSGRVASDFCSAPTNDPYYTIARSGTGERTTTIRQLAPNTNETAISTANELVSGSTVTLPSGYTA